MSALSGFRRMRLSRIAILTGLLATLALTVPWAAASGSGYNLSYSRAAGSTSVGAVDLTSVSSSDTGASNLTISFTVSGTPDLQSSNYFYFVWFGGSSAGNATGYVSFSNSATGSYYFFSGSSSSGTLP
ncbi:MAG: hypothetical protein L3J93_06485, partial [Thermoplasmata archaeon]|nr:hypothetical protein [Thermoplasmata archaeon]